MKHGLGKILATKRLPQMENLGVTDATRFIEVYQILATTKTITVVNKAGKIVRRVDIVDPKTIIRTTREIARGLVRTFKEAHSLKAIIGNADKGLLIEVVTAETLDMEEIKKETMTVDAVITTITQEEADELQEATRYDEPLLEHNSVAYWRKEKYGSIGKHGLVGLVGITGSAALFLATTPIVAILGIVFIGLPIAVLLHDITRND